MKKNLILLVALVGFLILSGAIYFLYKAGKIIPKAATEPTISLSSGSTTYQVGQQFPVYINSDSAGQAVYGIGIYKLRYDPNFLEFVSLQPGTMFPIYQPPGGEIDTNAGTIAISGRIQDGSTLLPSFSGIFATVTFRAIQTTANTTLTWDWGGLPISDTSNTNIIGSGGQDILVNAYETAFTITGVPTPVSVDIKANGQDSLTINSGDTATLSWTSQNASSCSASNGWSGDKATSGSESTGAISATATYSLTCSGTDGNNSDSVAVTVSTGGGGGKKPPTPPGESPAPPPTEQPTSEPPPTEEPTGEPTSEPTEITYTTPTPTQTAGSPEPTSPSPTLSQEPFTPKYSPSASPQTKIGGFSISSTVALILYIGIPVLVTCGVFFFWWRRRQKGATGETDKMPPPDDDEII